MGTVDKLEKVGRMVLWLALAAVCMIGILSVAQQQAAMAAASASLHAIEAKREEAQAKKAESEAKPTRLTFRSMGNALTLFSQSRATGELMFTNVSPRSGIVCVVGIVENQSTRQSMNSLASCEAVHPYASASIKVVFAGGDLDEMCKGAKCSLNFHDEPDAKAQ